MSFQIELDKYEAAYGRLVRRVQSAIQATFAEEAENGLTRVEIARELDLDASVVSRRLNGSGNSTLRSISDLFVAMGREPLANFETLEPQDQMVVISANMPALQSQTVNAQDFWTVQTTNSGYFRGQNFSGELPYTHVVFPAGANLLLAFDATPPHSRNHVEQEFLTQPQMVFR